MAKKKQISVKDLVASEDVVAHDNKKKDGRDAGDGRDASFNISAVKKFIAETEQTLDESGSLLSFGEEIFKEIKSPDPLIEQCKKSFRVFIENIVVDDRTGNKIKLQPFQEPWVKSLESDRQFITILAPRSHGKCVDSSTKVLTPTGFVTIKDISIGDTILTINRENKIIQSRIIGKSKNHKALYTIKLKNGQSIKISGEHRLLADWRYLKGSEMKVGDRLAVARRLSSLSDEYNTLSLSDLKLLGYWLSEGYKVSISLAISASDSDIISDSILQAENKGWKSYYSEKSRCVRINTEKSPELSTEWKKRFNLIGTHSDTIRVPPQIFQQGNSNIAIFLKALYSGDGWATHRGTPQIGYCSKSKDFCEDVQYLLLRFGIRTRLHSKQVKTQKGLQTYWSIISNDVDSIRLFHQYIGFTGQKQEMLIKLIKVIQSKLSHASSDMLPPTWQRFLPQEYQEHKSKLRYQFGINTDNNYATGREKVKRSFEAIGDTSHSWLYDNDLAWEEIISIDKGETEEDVYDIEVENDHTFLANGIVSHNSSVTKSLVAWLLGRNRNLRIGIISATEDQAISIAYSVEQILKDPNFIKVFGPMVPSKRTEKWTDTHKYVLRSRQMKDPSILACGVESSVVVGKRLDVIVCDDVVDEKNSMSEITRSSVSKWVMKNLIGCLESNGKFITLGTRYQSADLYGELYTKLARNNEATREIIIGGEIVTTPDSIFITQSTDEENVLWPENLNADALRKRRAIMGPVSFNMQYKNEAFNLSSTILSKDWLHFIPPEKLPGRNELNIWLGIDPNISQKESADYFAISVIGQHKETDKLYLIDVERFRGDVKEHVRRMQSIIERYHPSHAYVETNFGQILQAQYLQDAVNIPILGRPTTKSKEAKMGVIAPMFESGRVLVVGEVDPSGEGVEASPGIQAFYKEWVEFKGTHDDTLDAVEKGLSHLTNSALDIELLVVEPQTPEEKLLTLNREKTIVESDLEYIVSEPDTDDIQRIWRVRRGSIL